MVLFLFLVKVFLVLSFVIILFLILIDKTFSITISTFFIIALVISIYIFSNSTF